MNARLATIIMALASTALASPHQTDRTVTSRAHFQQARQKSSALAQTHESQQSAGETDASPQLQPAREEKAGLEQDQQPSGEAASLPDLEQSVPAFQLAPLPGVFGGPSLEGPRTSFPGSP